MPKIPAKLDSILLGFDTETTGVDLHHGASPFFVTTCTEQGVQQWWEWDVDPMTRKPLVPTEDLVEIRTLLAQNRFRLVLHNATFDAEAMTAADEWFLHNWPWSRTEDTLMAAHLLASNQPHDLTTVALIYLGVNLKKYEDGIEEATREAVRHARSVYPDWMVAKVGLPCMPSAKGQVWKNDMWLPRAIAQEENYPDDHPWWHLLTEYANVDSAATVELWRVMKGEIERQGLLEIYHERCKVQPVIMKMQSHGIHASRERMESLVTEFTASSEEHHAECIKLADNEIESLPANGSSNDLKYVMFEKFALESPKVSKKTGAPSMDKSVLDHWLATLDEDSTPYNFVTHLRDYRKRKTALGYLKSYDKFSKRWKPLSKRDKDTLILHPRFNPTGTHTLRWSSSNPNAQQISKQTGVNLRYAFGPAPGREWYSLDYDNLELRIPAYEAGETVMTDLFENPTAPPYYGSNHLLAFAILHPDKWNPKEDDSLLKAKKKYSTTWYAWTKAGNFAVQYGAMEKSGTADRAYHVDGGQALISENFGKIKLLNESMIEYANEYGYVETIPDKTVCPERGYPLYCEQGKWGGVRPTLPLNFHVQGTACWIIAKAMVSCQLFLDDINKHERTENCYHQIMQVHDELVFDFPAGDTPRRRKKNALVAAGVRSLMEVEGDNVNVPLTCGLDKHDNNWSMSL